MLKNPTYTSWNAYYYALSTDILEKAWQSVAANRLAPAVAETMELAYRHYPDIFCEEVKQATLIHGDFFVANILIAPKTLEPLAFIDPFESMWADVEYELFALNNVNASCFQLYEAYVRKAQVSKMCAVKCAFYALYKEIMWYQLYGVKYDDFIAGLCEKMKQQLAAYNML